LYHTLGALAASIPLGGGRVLHSALVSALTHPGMLYHAVGPGASHNHSAVRCAVGAAMADCVRCAWEAAACTGSRRPRLTASPDTVLVYHRYGEQFRGSVPAIDCDANGATLIRNYIALLRRAMARVEPETIEMLWPAARTPQYRSKQARKYQELLRRRAAPRLLARP
jgi:hypothetical protein